MDNIPRTRLIRQYIRDVLQEIAGTDPTGVAETLLIRDGLYCGHRFRQNEYEAVWFVEENQVKFHGPGGQLLRCMDANQIAHWESQQAA